MLAVLLFVVLGIVWLSISNTRDTVAQVGPPPVPHTLEGREDCLLCHKIGGAISLPQDHAGRSIASCLLCHKQEPAPAQVTPSPTQPSPTPSASQPSPTPSPTASSQPTVIPPGLAAESCLLCHGSPGLTLDLPSGERLDLYVDVGAFVTSVHGSRLLCTDCHRSQDEYPHPTRQLTTRREYGLALYEVCQRCHFANYTRTLDSVHYQVLSQGNIVAPVCTDCHGAHQVLSPQEPRTKVSQACSQCHMGIYQEYSRSVHGSALASNSPDVPVCTDCHGVHNIGDPRTTTFHLSIPELCSRCHSDQELMGRYGLSTKVTGTYLADFHGATISLRKQEGSQAPVVEAVCTDCHGVHNIARTDEPASPVMKANLLEVCRRCHPDATANFSGAWLSHYEPSLSKSPMVFLVRLFYWIFIPFVIAGLGFQVLLDLWRTAINR